MTDTRPEIAGLIDERAPTVFIEYKPKGSDEEGPPEGVVTFRKHEVIDLGDSLKVLGRTGNVTADFADILTRTWFEGVDPVTNADLTNVSTAGVISIIQAAFQTLNEEAQEPEPPE